MPLILAVDDEPNIMELLEFNLSKEGYRFIGVTSGRDAITAANEEKPDLIILDIMLPEIDGYDVLRAIKDNKRTAGIPVIMLSAKDEIIDKVLGLELGAEDYVTKPFSPREILARVKVHLRRKSQPTPSEEKVKDEIRIKNLLIRPDRYMAILDGKKLDLTPKEFELLHLLAANPGRVFTRDILLERIWGYDQIRETRTVDVHIRYLRQKIEKEPSTPEYIETVRSVGYRFHSGK